MSSSNRNREVPNGCGKAPNGDTQVPDQKFDAFALRLRKSAHARNLNAAGVASAVGITNGTMSRYWNGERIPPANLLFPMADAVGQDARWLVEGVAGPSADNDDQVDLASIDFAYGFGGAYLDAGAPNVDKVRFSRAWLRARGITAPSEYIGVAQGIGDSMEPMFFDRDMLFFDRSARLEDHMGDKVWVFAYGQVGMVKILRPLPDGTIKIISANRMYPEEIASADEIYIIGRVVSSWRNH